MTQPQMSENVAATLSYALGWVTGLVFYFIDKRPFVRFHAAQSIVVFGALHILIILTTGLFGLGSPREASPISLWVCPFTGFWT